MTDPDPRTHYPPGSLTPATDGGPPYLTPGSWRIEQPRETADRTHRQHADNREHEVDLWTGVTSR